jgi:transcription initiation factor TFIIH subunit 1
MPFNDYQSTYAQTIDLDDLHDAQASADIILEMQDRQRYFEGQISSSASAEEAAKNVGFIVSIFSI